MDNENVIELHYWLKDNSHKMNAFVLNKCEWELLNFLKEIANVNNADLIVEAEAISEGGIIEHFHLKLSPSTKSKLKSAAIAAFISLFFTDIPKMGIEKVCEFLGKNPEMENLLLEEKRLEIEGKKLDNELKRQELEKLKRENAQALKDTFESVSSNTKVKKRASNFYEELLKEPKVGSITINNYIGGVKILQSPVEVKREDFSKYILVSNELDSIIDENANIEIVSPVLKKGKYQWRGIYNGNILQFNMKSSEFKTLVQTGRVEFKNGTCITCVLEMKRNINNLGEEVITSYNVLKVIDYYDSVSSPQKTNEGIRYTQEKEAEKRQLNLFSDSEFEEK